MCSYGFQKPQNIFFFSYYQMLTQITQIIRIFNLTSTLNPSMKLFLLIFALSTSFAFASDRGEELKVWLTDRVDKSNPVVADIYSLWAEYLRRRATGESVDDLFISEGHTVLDPAEGWIFFDPQILTVYRPMIMSIEPDRTVDASRWVIKTMISSVDTASQSTYVAAIHRIYAEFRSGQWKLRSTLYVEMEAMAKEVIGDFTFHYYPSRHVFDSSQAMASVEFSQRCAHVLDVERPEKTDFVIAASRDEVARMIGFDYYARPIYGIAYPEDNLLITGLGSERHDHELVHIVGGRFAEAHPLLVEGLAVWLGGSLGQSLSEMKVQYARRNVGGKSPGIESILADRLQHVDDFYTVGGIIVEGIYKKHGSKGLKEIMSMSLNDATVVEAVAASLGISSSFVDEWLRAEALKQPFSYTGDVGR